MPEQPHRNKVPESSSLLSLARFTNYLKLLYWILYYPQALKQYFRCTVSQAQGENNRWDLISMIAVLTGISMAVVAMVAVFLLGLRSKESISVAPPDPVWVTALTATVATVLIASAICAIRERLSSALAWAWTTGVASMVLFFALLRNLQQAQIVWLDEIILFLVAGALFGLMYSQAAAFRNYGLAYWREHLVHGLIFGSCSLPVILITEIEFHRTRTIADLVVYVLVAFGATFLGFMLAAPRFEDWLYGWLRNRHRNRILLDRLPHVTFISVPGLTNSIKKRATGNWDKTLHDCAIVWQHTRQHRAISQALYSTLATAEPAYVSDRITALVRQDATWQKPVWFIDGGERKTTDIISVYRDKPIYHYRNHNLANVILLSMVLCQEATIQDAIDLLEQVPARSADLEDMTLRLHAIKALEEAPRPIGKGERPQLDIPKSRLKSPIWRAIAALLETYHYAWLANRCQSPERQARAAMVARTQLRTVTGCVTSDESIDACTVKLLLRVANAWEDDLRLIESGGVPPKPFQSATQTEGTGPRKPDNPFEYDEPLWDEGMLYGRKKAIRKLKDAWFGSHFQVVEIVGPVLSGKTSVYLGVSNRYKGSAGQVVTAYVSLRHLNTIVPASLRIANALYDELISEFDAPPTIEELQREPFRTIERMIHTICNSQHRKLIVAIDDLDYMERLTDLLQEIRRFLLFLFQLNEIIRDFGVVVLATRDTNAAYKALVSQTTRFAKPIRIGCITSSTTFSQVSDLLNHPVSTFPNRFTPDATALIIKLSGGLPYLIQLIAWTVCENFNDKYRYFQGTSVSGQTVRLAEPLFDVDDINRVLTIDTFRHGCLYYYHRLCNHFEPDAQVVRKILEQFASAKGKTLTASELATKLVNRLNNGAITLTVPEIRELLKRLKQQQVLSSSDDVNYCLRIDLICTIVTKYLR